MDVNSLTIDYQKMKKLTAREKLEAIQKAPNAPSFLASLTPSQLAELFPNYFKRELPDIGKATSGGIPLSQTDTGATTSKYTTPNYSPPNYSPPTSSKNRDGDITKSTQPKRSPDVKLSWEEKIKRAVPGAGNKTSVPQKEGYSPGFAKIRSQFKDQITDQEIRALAALGKVETGGMSPRSKRAWLETYFNRATVRGSSLSSLRSGRNAGYWGGGLGNPGKVSDKQFEEWSGYINDVMNGSNLINGATDNASNDYRHGNLLAKKRIDKGYPAFWTEGKTGDPYKDMDQGELAYVDQPHLKGWKKMIEQVSAFDAQAKKALEEASTIPEQDPSKTGGTDLDAMHKATDTATAMPQDLDDGLKAAIGSKPEAEQKAILEQIKQLPGGIAQANQFYQESLAAEPGKAPPAVARDSITGKILADGKIVESKAPERLIPGDTSYLSLERNPRMEGMDPNLVSVLNEGARRFQENNPGYRVVINGTVKDGKMVGGPGSAKRIGGNNPSSYHLKGKALDVTIVAPDGTALKNFKSGEFAKEYQMLGNFMKASQERYAPDWDDFRGGIYFGGKYALDAMHFDRDSRGLGMGSSGNWETGFNKSAMKRFGIDPDTNMGMREFRQIYGYEIAEARRQSAQALATASEVQTGETTTSQAIDPNREQWNIEGLDTEGLTLPKPESLGTDTATTTFIQDWNKMPLEERQNVLAEAKKSYDSSWTPSWWQTEEEYIKDHMIKDLQERRKSQKKDARPLTVSPMPRPITEDAAKSITPQSSVSPVIAPSEKTQVKKNIDQSNITDQQTKSSVNVFPEKRNDGSSLASAAPSSGASKEASKPITSSENKEGVKKDVTAIQSRTQQQQHPPRVADNDGALKTTQGQTPSHARAMAAVQFKEKGNHFGGGASNLV